MTPAAVLQPGAYGVPCNTGPFGLLVIGASFGGPKAVETLLCALPARCRVPVAVCQHISPGFTTSWAERIDRHSRISVQEAGNRVVMKPGCAYIAPAGLQMRFMRSGSSGMIRLDPDFADSLHVPSVDMMMSSAAAEFGSKTLAVLLTGLGSDGASGMLSVRAAGGYTIAESAETAASHSMPGAAIGLGAVVEELPLDAIVERVAELVMV